jgi:hypothetical protein
MQENLSLLERKWGWALALLFQLHAWLILFYRPTRFHELRADCFALLSDESADRQRQIQTRKKIIEENRLEAVVSMPSGVFKPYAGVSTAVLIFTRGDKTDRIWL